ncbi:hypothetical protein NECAME_16312 [Necator americanus]|uniref:THAP4-like heme-binding domain-containing protein n=1 Tax=Necator americanus TaxID=51031 RepID=W2TZL4_NECAM|nr:hypothetical protein NECAME_16312 [Necator americanus]ETN86482.1 hypothetical protein NECAME_16312 [Necator americanus]
MKIASNRSTCDEPGLVMEHCPRMCQACDGLVPVDAAFDVRRLPKELKSIAWMIGRWRSEFGGKAFFPTIPKFTYGEQIDISISDITRKGKPSLNYTYLPFLVTWLVFVNCCRHHTALSAFAWDISVPENELVEIHSENGYITLNRNEKANVDIVSLTTAMSNGK